MLRVSLDSLKGLQDHIESWKLIRSAMSKASALSIILQPNCFVFDLIHPYNHTIGLVALSSHLCQKTRIEMTY